MDNLIYIIRYT